MVKTIIHGVNGVMGRILADLIADTEGIEVVAGIDIADKGDTDYPVFTSPEACDVAADVVIDFSVAKAVDGLIDFCRAKGLPVVLCTTGLSESQLASIKELSSQVAVLRSANMSLGINTLLDVLNRCSPIFAEAGFDIEIVEKHHNRKLDAPSGTALALADAVNDSLGGEYEYIYDRSSRQQKRDPKEIGIVAVRGGNIAGEHEVIFAGLDEIVTLKHTASSRAIFAKGAISAAKFLAGKAPGMYSMADVIKA